MVRSVSSTLPAGPPIPVEKAMASSTSGSLVSTGGWPRLFRRSFSENSAMEISPLRVGLSPNPVTSRSVDKFRLARLAVKPLRLAVSFSRFALAEPASSAVTSLPPNGSPVMSNTAFRPDTANSLRASLAARRALILPSTSNVGWVVATRNPISSGNSEPRVMLLALTVKFSSVTDWPVLLSV